jgi:O-6-methylguanine DNA methyltransferase
MIHDTDPTHPLDALLEGYFRPRPFPSDLPRRALEQLHHAVGDPIPPPERLAIEATPRGVCLVRRLHPAPGGGAAPGDRAARRRIERAREEIAEYFEGRRSFFSVPVDLSAIPPFQREVLEAARAIPFGEWRSYAWIARRIGRPAAARAVGQALGRNPVPILVPCHRVLRETGGIGGYIFGTALKRRLLDLETTTPVLEGCSSTRVVCRVGCPAAGRMRPDRRVIFASVADARSVGYRPCGSCRPADAHGTP